MTRRKFEKLVEEGIRSIPKKFREKLDNIVIRIEEEPSPEQRKVAGLEKDETLLGLYEGISIDRRGSFHSGTLPDTITLFRKPILAAARTQEEVKKIVKETVWHEIAHYFGMDEEAVLNAEKRRES